MPEFASNTDNISNPTGAELEKGFAGCDGDGLPMTSANINAVLNTISKAAAEGDEALQDAIDELPPEEFISAMALVENILVSQYNTGRTPLNVDLSKYLPVRGRLVLEDGKVVLICKQDGSDEEVKTEVEIDTTPCVSSDSGNLLELREDSDTGKFCLYYGIEAEPNLRNLYVDKEYGDDTVSLEDGGGTRSKPFRTLQKAFDVTPGDKSNTIHIRCAYDNGDQQVHEIEKVHRVLGGAKRSIREYDQPYVSQAVIDCWRQFSVYGYPLYAKENIKPILRNGWISNSRYNYLQYIKVEEGSRLTITGAEIRTFEMPMNDVGRTDRYGILQGDGEITLSACRVVKDTDNISIYQGNAGWNIDFYFNNTVFEIDDPEDVGIRNNFINLSGATANIAVSNGSYVVRESVEQAAIDAGCGKPVTFEPGNAVEVLTESGSVTGIARHSSGVPLNVTSNFEI